MPGSRLSSRAARRRARDAGSGAAAPDPAGGSPPPRPTPPGLRCARLAVRLWLRLRFRLAVDGLDRLPAGPCVVVSDHRSLYDPLLLGALLPEVPAFLAADELVGSGRRWRLPRALRPLAAWAVHATASIPVTRQGRDTAAVRAALRVLGGGRRLVVFPEGGIGTERRYRGGTWLAARAHVPTVTVRLTGLPGRGWRPRVGLRVLAPPASGSTEHGRAARQGLRRGAR